MTKMAKRIGTGLGGAVLAAGLFAGAGIAGAAPNDVFSASGTLSDGQAEFKVTNKLNEPILCAIVVLPADELVPAEEAIAAFLERNDEQAEEILENAETTIGLPDGIEIDPGQTAHEVTAGDALDEDEYAVAIGCESVVNQKRGGEVFEISTSPGGSGSSWGSLELGSLS